MVDSVKSHRMYDTLAHWLYQAYYSKANIDDTGKCMCGGQVHMGTLLTIQVLNLKAL